MGPGVNNVFQINLGPLGFQRLGLNQTSCMEPFYVFFSFAFHVFKQVPISISCLGECYNIVVAVKLQKCFVCYEAFTQQMKLNIVFLTLNVNSHFLILIFFYIIFFSYSPPVLLWTLFRSLEFICPGSELFTWVSRGQGRKLEALWMVLHKTQGRSPLTCLN